MAGKKKKNHVNNNTNRKKQMQMMAETMESGPELSRSSFVTIKHWCDRMRHKSFYHAVVPKELREHSIIMWLKGSCCMETILTALYQPWSALGIDF